MKTSTFANLFNYIRFLLFTIPFQMKKEKNRDESFRTNVKTLLKSEIFYVYITIICVHRIECFKLVFDLIKSALFIFFHDLWCSFSYIFLFEVPSLKNINFVSSHVPTEKKTVFSNWKLNEMYEKSFNFSAQKCILEDF